MAEYTTFIVCDILETIINFARIHTHTHTLSRKWLPRLFLSSSSSACLRCFCVRFFFFACAHFVCLWMRIHSVHYASGCRAGNQWKSNPLNNRFSVSVLSSVTNKLLLFKFTLTNKRAGCACSFATASRSLSLCSLSYNYYFSVVAVIARLKKATQFYIYCYWNADERILLPRYLYAFANFSSLSSIPSSFG